MDTFITRKNDVTIDLNKYAFDSYIGQDYISHRQYFTKLFNSWEERYNPNFEGFSSSWDEYNSIIDDMHDASLERQADWEAMYPDINIDDYVDKFGMLWKFKCEGCGTWSNYGAKYINMETGEVLMIGSTCVQQFKFGSDIVNGIEALMDKMRRVEAKGKRVANIQKFIHRTSHQTWDLIRKYYFRNKILADFYNKIPLFELSEKQINFIHVLVQQELDKDEATEFKKANGIPALVEGRKEFKGVITKIWINKNDVKKMLIDVNGNYKLISNVTDTMRNLTEGQTIVFKGTITPSQHDEYFGFAKRVMIIETDALKVTDISTTRKGN